MRVFGSMKKWTRSESVRQMATLASGTVLANAITFFAMPFVTRLYTPSEIGVIGVFLAFTSFWYSSLTCRYESALLVVTEQHEMAALARICVALIVFMSILSFPFLYLLSKLSILGFGVLPQWSAIITVPILLGMGGFAVLRVIWLREAGFKVIRRTTVTKSIANVTTRLLLGIGGFGVFGLFLAEIVSAWASSTTLYSGSKLVANLRNQSIDLVRLKQVALKYVKFPKYEFPSVLIDQITLMLPVPIVASLYGTTAAGWYSLARLVGVVPNAQIGSSLGDVLQMRFARSIRNRDRALEQIFWKSVAMLAAIGIPIMLIMMLVAPTIFGYLFGVNWIVAGQLLRVMTPWFYFALVVSTVSTVISVVQRQELKLIYDLVALATIIGVYIASRSLRLNLEEFTFWLSLGMCLTYILYLGILSYVVIGHRQREA